MHCITIGHGTTQCSKLEPLSPRVVSPRQKRFAQALRNVFCLSAEVIRLCKVVYERLPEVASACLHKRFGTIRLCKPVYERLAEVASACLHKRVRTIRLCKPVYERFAEVTSACLQKRMRTIRLCNPVYERFAAVASVLGCRDVGNGVEEEKSWEVMRRGRLGVGVCLWFVFRGERKMGK